MKRLFKYFFVALFAIVFYVSSFNLPWILNPDGTTSVAEAQQTKKQQRQEQKRLKKQRRQEQKRLKKQRRQERKRAKKCKKNPRKCQPPTVSELPIQYMVMSGAVVIMLSGGILFLIRKRKTKNSLEA